MAHIAKKTAKPRAARRIPSAEERALRMLSEMGLHSAPIHVEQVASRLGLEVERAVLGDDVSGLLVVQDGRGVIGVSVNQAPARQRFTIAHEIGHYILHRDAMPVFIDRQFLRPYFAAYRDAASSTGEFRMEREANAFAAALLMPAMLVHQAVAELQGDLADEEAVDLLAKHFQVSRQSMSFRLANLAASAGELSE